MSKPIVAVVGRPNVGKSTLFNKIVGSRVSIVEDTPGVTRDRIYAEAEWSGVPFVLIDTGGIEPDSDDIILSRMREQAQIAIDTADVIIFIVDGRAGLTAADREVGEMLRKTGRNVILVANKIDTPNVPDGFYDFYELGLGEPVPISAANMLNLGDLLDLVIGEFPKSTGEEEEDEDIKIAVIGKPNVGKSSLITANMLNLGDLLDLVIGEFPKSTGEEEEDEDIKIAVIGKPNVGKSSLINAMIGEERVIVSDIAGTTRDSIDTPFEHEGQKYTLIDTAGIRRRKKVTEDIERFSVIRAITAIERSDVCIVMIDAEEGITEQDKKIAGLAHEAGKGIIVVVNKWDLITAIERSDVCIVMIDAEEGITEQDKKIAGLAHEAGKGIIVVVNKWDLIKKDTHTMNRFEKEIRQEFSFMPYAPLLFISVKTGQRMMNVLKLAGEVAEQRAMRIPTGQLNAVIADATLMKQPPSDKGKKLKIYYVTQVGVKPPLFSFKVNKRELMHFSYSRYLENQLRDNFKFTGTSVKFVFREKGENELE